MAADSGAVLGPGCVLSLPGNQGLYHLKTTTVLWLESYCGCRPAFANSNSLALILYPPVHASNGMGIAGCPQVTLRILSFLGPRGAEMTAMEDSTVPAAGRVCIIGDSTQEQKPPLVTKDRGLENRQCASQVAPAMREVFAIIFWQERQISGKTKRFSAAIFSSEKTHSEPG